MSFPEKLLAFSKSAGRWLLYYGWIFLVKLGLICGQNSCILFNEFLFNVMIILSVVLQAVVVILTGVAEVQTSIRMIKNLFIVGTVLNAIADVLIVAAMIVKGILDRQKENSQVNQDIAQLRRDLHLERSSYLSPKKNIDEMDEEDPENLLISNPERYLTRDSPTPLANLDDGLGESDPELNRLDQPSGRSRKRQKKKGSKQGKSTDSQKMSVSKNWLIHSKKIPRRDSADKLRSSEDPSSARTANLDRVEELSSARLTTAESTKKDLDVGETDDREE